MENQKIDVAYALRMERDSKTSAGLYDWSQVQFSFNSNHMEGSTLTLGQTEQIYHNREFIADKDQRIRRDDQIETENHFKLFNYMLDTINHPLTLEYIKKLQGILKKGTSDEENPLKVVGDFKRINNIINNTRLGDTQTSRAADVPRDLKALKGRSAFIFLKKHPEIRKSQYWSGHLWSPSYYMSTLGNMSKEVVEKYINDQKYNEMKKAPHRA